MKPLGLADPRELGGYRLLALLGVGGMGRVYLGRAPGGRTVAVKLIHPHFAYEPEFRRRFRQEVTAAQRVAGEWTMPVLGADTEAEMPWLATGFVPGPALTQVVDELHGALPEFSVWRLAEGLARALLAVHGAGVTHRDLKPSNVLITLEGPRVIDFGIARATDGTVATRTGVVIGSPGYMSPEQVRGERLTNASDIFGLGAVLAYAATGEGPFGTRDSAAHSLMHRVVAEPPTLDGLTGPMRDLVERCLAKEALDRPSLEEIAKEAEGHQDPDGAEGVWLPPALTAQLGKEAARLLALSDPTDTPLAAPVAAPVAVPPTQVDSAGAPYVPATPSSADDATPHLAAPRGEFGPPPTAPAVPATPTELATPAVHAAPTELATSPPGDTPSPSPSAPSSAVVPESAPAPADDPSADSTPVSPPRDDPDRPAELELSPKSKTLMGWLQIVFGFLGIGRFYSGHWFVGILQVLTVGGVFFWGFIDGIAILRTDERRDGKGRLMTKRRSDT